MFTLWLPKHGVLCFDLRDTRQRTVQTCVQTGLGLITWFVNLARYRDPLFEQESLDMASDNRARILRMTNDLTVRYSVL